MKRTMAAVVLLAAAACGGGDVEVPLNDDERAVTDAEAARLAETLVNNRELGGARVQLTARLPGGSTATLDGEVDFDEHAGRAVVEMSGGPAAVTEVIWTETAVYERVPGLIDLADQTGLDVEWVVRAPDPNGRDLDGLIGVVLGLSAEQVDNAVLIEQEPGTAWLRADTVVPVGGASDVAVDVFRYGTGTILWLEQGETTLWRFESLSNDRPLVADLFDHGPRSIDVPESAVPADDVAELYRAAVGIDP